MAQRVDTHFLAGIYRPLATAEWIDDMRNEADERELGDKVRLLPAEGLKIYLFTRGEINQIPSPTREDGLELRRNLWHMGLSFFNHELTIATSGLVLQSRTLVAKADSSEKLAEERLVLAEKICQLTTEKIYPRRGFEFGIVLGEIRDPDACEAVLDGLQNYLPDLVDLQKGKVKVK